MSLKQPPLNQIDEYTYEIPQSFRKDMRVPARLLASDELLKVIGSDRSLDQLVNMATLPGVERYAMAMPDIHEGYGFCLAGDTDVLTAFGYMRSIQDFIDDASPKVSVFDTDEEKLQHASVQRFFRIRPKNKVVEITTQTGKKITATEDHPCYTPYGMAPAGDLRLGDRIAVSGFEGVPYEDPPKHIIVSERDIARALAQRGIKKESARFRIILQKLYQRDLLPLTHAHPKLPYLIKIAAFVFGDGSMNFIGKRGDGVIHFSGKAADLEMVREDVRSIGYMPSPLHSRTRVTKKGMKTTDTSFVVNASSLVVLLEALGVPRGVKVAQPYRMPRWVFMAPKWQQRLFLAALFGCELRMPHRRLTRRGNFNAPVFPMNKAAHLLENGKAFLKDIERLLQGFGVACTSINQRRRHVAQNGTVTWALELLISSRADNLIKLWGTVGFAYNRKRASLASAAVCYLRLKQKLLKAKQNTIAVRVPELLESGLSYRSISKRLSGKGTSERFIVDVCTKLRAGQTRIVPRVPPSFPRFKEYLVHATQELGESGLVWDAIETMREVPPPPYVYDITVNHPAHNFIANGCVVSNCIGGVVATRVEDGIISPGGVGYDINCGVRLLKTDADKEVISEKLEDLANQLQRDIPSGLGQGGDLKVGKERMDDVLERGVEWMLDEGLAEERDRTFCEAAGRLPEADPSFVSDRAKKRGRDQLGTLGSGNHFVEVQAVDEILLPEVAEALGLHEGQVVIMIHTGSRGLGHQVATDYIKDFMPKLVKWGLRLPDKELVGAPVRSPEGKQYFQAMNAAANFAFANRQFLTHLARGAWQQVFSDTFGIPELVYDIAHNMGKIERHGKDEQELLVHRKGATRAFGPGRPELPEAYRTTGQPVFIPGSMGTASYVLVGAAHAEEVSFATTCHGAGRVMSRSAAKRTINYEAMLTKMRKQGIVVRGGSKRGLLEEAPGAYKDVEEVVAVVDAVGIAKKVARLTPLAVIKG